MTPVTNKRLIFNEYITNASDLVPGRTTVVDTTQTIDLDNVPLNGGILIKILVLALEPFLFSRMRATPLGFKIGEPTRNYGVGVVLRSEHAGFKVGDHVQSPNMPFAEYSIQENVDGFKKIDNKHNVPLSVFIGIAGIAGMTAYAAWKEYSRAKKGEVVFVTSGAGAVGSLVIQLAKRDGMKVIASAGSDEKVEFMKDLGADVAFNYKTTKTSIVLGNEGPIDVYWDNVGGEALEAALDAASRHARVIECGMLSGYGGKIHAVSNLFNIVIKEISMNGFTITTLAPKYSEDFAREVPALVASKELKYREDVTRGLDHAMETFVKFMKGEGIGKSIVVVADE